jgi:hypothetical protein
MKSNDLEKLRRASNFFRSLSINRPEFYRILSRCVGNSKKSEKLFSKKGSLWLTWVDSNTETPRISNNGVKGG